MSINQYQRAFLDTYEGGEYAHATSAADLDGDSLAVFLFNELSSQQGCDSADVAAYRLANVKREVDSVVAAVASVILKERPRPPKS